MAVSDLQNHRLLLSALMAYQVHALARSATVHLHEFLSRLFFAMILRMGLIGGAGERTSQLHSLTGKAGLLA